MTKRRLWDISQALRVGIPVWPGDTAYGEERTATIGPGCPVTVSRLTLSTHTGTHVDGPLHYDPTGDAVGALDLAPFIGPAQVLTIPPAAGLVQPAHLEGHLSGVPRVLLRTWERFPEGQWDPGFTAVAPAAVEMLAAAGVVLLGTDAPSVDPQDSKELLAHHACRRTGVLILEGLVLDGVPDGTYELVALPLRLTTADGSPVRAVLLELGGV